MKNFWVTARETIRYSKLVQAESKEDLQKKLINSDILFEDSDIDFAENFEICDIEEEGETT
jgi:hypothetical protein